MTKKADEVKGYDKSKMWENKGNKGTRLYCPGGFIKKNIKPML
jgi:hypothetical protein